MKIIPALKLSQVATFTAIAAICCIPIKINLTYIFLFISFFLILQKEGLKSLPKFLTSDKIFLNLIIFISISLIMSLFGINPLKSSLRLFQLFFLLLITCTVFSFALKTSITKVCLFLFSIQALTSIYSIGEFSFNKFPEAFIGAVSESGQLSLILPFLLALILNKKNVYEKILCEKYILILFFLFVGLIVNLKRGPILGVFISTMIILLISERKKIIPIFILLLVTTSSSPILQSRFLSSNEHFNIAGGRSVMWSIGTDLIKKFPIGIGYGNSKVIQEYAKEIPPEHKHFHSNYLNIAVETGLIGLLFFLSWLFSLLKLSFHSIKKYSSPVALGTFVSIISWSIAGIVEYSFGDTEVLLVLILILQIFNEDYTIRQNLENHNILPDSI